MRCSSQYSAAQRQRPGDEADMAAMPTEFQANAGRQLLGVWRHVRECEGVVQRMQDQGRDGDLAQEWSAAGAGIVVAGAEGYAGAR